MKTILKTRKLWDVIENGVPAIVSTSVNTPEMTKKQEDLVMKDMMALQILQTAVTDAIFPRIAPATSANDAWNALEMEFQGSSQVRMINLQSLRREYENLKMKDGEDIKVFTEKLIDLGNQLRVHGEEKTDYQIVQKILISLPEKFDSIVVVMEQTKDLTSLPVTELIGTLKAHEKRLSIREERSTEGAFYGEKFVSKGGNKCGDKSQDKAEKWCDFCTCDNHNESDCWRKQHRDVSLPAGVRCFACNKPGHVVKNCKVRKAERANLSLEETYEESDNEGHMLFSAVEEASSSNVNDETWFEDSRQGSKT
ncbi:hypothetical protein V5N11_006155 [Cardamine amara subsp. amara]|uniref:CCHC-type domain-containing protein n=1 Tax=Cardamine amara subsp. amara TaxID=228776 RepID=A0ABD0Z820_CARAN